MMSCYTQKGVTYLQTDQDLVSMSTQNNTYLVQPNDILNVKIQSRDPEQTIYFNIASTQTRNMDADPASLFLTGYPVDDNGYINLAIIGEVEVAGLSLEEITQKLQGEIDKYLINALIIVRLTSFKVSVLGDVKNPGTNYIYNNQATIFEALSAAGDANLSAKRDKIKLIRQNGTKSVVVNLDLTDPKIVESPFYFMNPNDVIYVETSNQNILRNNLALFSIVLTTISTGLLILNFVSTN